MGKESKSSDEETKPTVAKSALELQRFKLAKLMKNPDKPVVIPERLKDKKMPHVPDFVRNVMGSSAGAGSGEFHVYRHLRRKEYARQKFIQEKSEKQLLEEAYHQKLLDNKQAAEEKTAKKRAKRLKKKAKKKLKQSNSKCNPAEKNETSKDESESEDESDNELDKEQNSLEMNKEEVSNVSKDDVSQTIIETYKKADDDRATKNDAEENADSEVGEKRSKDGSKDTLTEVEDCKDFKT